MFGAAAIYGDVTKRSLASWAGSCSWASSACSSRWSSTSSSAAARGHLDHLDRRRRALHGADRLRRPAHPVGRPRRADRLDGEGGGHRRAPRCTWTSSTCSCSCSASSAAATESVRPRAGSASPTARVGARSGSRLEPCRRQARSRRRPRAGWPASTRSSGPVDEQSARPRPPAAAARRGSPGRGRSRARAACSSCASVSMPSATTPMPQAVGQRDDRLDDRPVGRRRRCPATNERSILIVSSGRCLR